MALKTITPRSIHSLLFALALWQLPPVPLQAQQEQLIRCPVTEIMTEVTTPMPEDWWHAPQLGRIFDAEVRVLGGDPVLACLYQVADNPVAVVRRPPADAPNCIARSEGFSFVCAAGEVSGNSSTLAGQSCPELIQDRIEWDYKGNKRWARSNLEKLCHDAFDSDQPGICFDRVMHGGVNHGKGERWKWRFALRLCAGTRDAASTINCFSAAIDNAVPWPEAIEACRVKS